MTRLLVAAAVLAFWMGGWVISEFGHVERTLAEMEGIWLTCLLGALAAIAKAAESRFEEDDGKYASISSGTLFRK